MTKITFWAIRPLPLNHIVFSQNGVQENLPKEDFDLKRQLCFPDEGEIGTSNISTQMIIQRTDSEHLLSIPFPKEGIRSVSEYKVLNHSSKLEDHATI